MFLTKAWTSLISLVLASSFGLKGWGLEGSKGWFPSHCSLVIFVKNTIYGLHCNYAFLTSYSYSLDWNYIKQLVFQTKLYFGVRDNNFHSISTSTNNKKLNIHFQKNCISEPNSPVFVKILLAKLYSNHLWCKLIFAFYYQGLLKDSSNHFELIKKQNWSTRL